MIKEFDFFFILTEFKKVSTWEIQNSIVLLRTWRRESNNTRNSRYCHLQDIHQLISLAASKTSQFPTLFPIHNIIYIHHTASLNFPHKIDRCVSPFSHTAPQKKNKQRHGNSPPGNWNKGIWWANCWGRIPWQGQVPWYPLRLDGESSTLPQPDPRRRTPGRCSSRSTCLWRKKESRKTSDVLSPGIHCGSRIFLPFLCV